MPYKKILLDGDVAGGGNPAPWDGKLHVAIGDGNPTQPAVMFGFQNTVVSVAGPTPTGIGTAVGRLVQFRFRNAITIATIRYFGVGTVSNAYTMAMYKISTGARVWLLDPANTTAATWTAITTGLPITIAADDPHWFGLGTKVTGTTAGLRSPASPIASSLGVTTIPGQLANYGVRFAQVALTAGAWPTTLPALAAAAFASGGSTGTLPIIFLEA